MYTFDEVDSTKPPRATRFLNHTPLCGLCKFKCCQSKGLSVETTEAEAEAHNLPRKFPIDGHCRCLGEAGCSLGAARPVMCRFAPLQVKGELLVVGHWFVLNCPTPKDYEKLPDVGDGKHRYRRKDGVHVLRKNNSHEMLALDVSLEDFPNALENNIDGFIELYGVEAVAKVRADLNTMNKLDQGGFV